MCGDGALYNTGAGTEECDNGAENGPGKACNASCAPNVCGDGDKGPDEQCDDGNKVGSDGCSASCKLEECGNKILDPGEECDDGNNVNTDACVTGCKNAVCGDGFLRAGVEQCDDGNLVNGDGCEANCAPTPLPTECQNYAVLSDANRNVNRAAGCDNPLATNWYRFTGAAGMLARPRASSEPFLARHSGISVETSSGPSGCARLRGPCDGARAAPTQAPKSFSAGARGRGRGGRGR